MLKILLFSLFLACSTTQEEPSPNKPYLDGMTTQLLNSKLDSYVKWSQELRNVNGFVPLCDSVLFSSLSLTGGSKVSIKPAEMGGRWFRRTEKECYVNGNIHFKAPGSDSDISKDMYAGILWGMLESYRLKVEPRHNIVKRLERTIAYGKSKNWVMGRGPLGETFLTPPLRRDLADLLYKWGGKNHRVMRAYPHVWDSGRDGYPAHLQMVRILARKYMDGKIPSGALDRIKEHYKRAPYNALYSFMYHCFTDKDFTEPAKLLLDKKMFPSGRLPEDQDRCSNYLWERDKGTGDYEACRSFKGRSHDGVDYIFVAGLILKELGEL